MKNKAEAAFRYHLLATWVRTEQKKQDSEQEYFITKSGFKPLEHKLIYSFLVVSVEGGLGVFNFL